MKKFIAFALFILLAFSFAYSADCAIRPTSCNAGETPIFSVSAATNAHAGNTAAYTNKVCCPFAAGSTTALKLSGTTNAHAGDSTSSYTTLIDVAQTSCSSTVCNAGDSCIVKLSGTTNAHVEDCSLTNYSTKICCSSTAPPVPTCNVTSVSPTSVAANSGTQVIINAQGIDFSSLINNVQGTINCGDGATGSFTSCTSGLCIVMCQGYNDSSGSPYAISFDVTNGSQSATCTTQITVNPATPPSTPTAWSIALSTDKGVYTASDTKIDVTITITNNTGSPISGATITFEIKNALTGAPRGSPEDIRSSFPTPDIPTGPVGTTPTPKTITIDPTPPTGIDYKKNYTISATMTVGTALNQVTKSASTTVSIVPQPSSVSIPEMPGLFVLLIAFSIIVVYEISKTGRK